MNNRYNRWTFNHHQHQHQQQQYSSASPSASPLPIVTTEPVRQQPQTEHHPQPARPYIPTIHNNLSVPIVDSVEAARRRNSTYSPVVQLSSSPVTATAGVPQRTGGLFGVGGRRTGLLAAVENESDWESSSSSSDSSHSTTSTTSSTVGVRSGHTGTTTTSTAKKEEKPTNNTTTPNIYLATMQWSNINSNTGNSSSSPMIQPTTTTLQPPARRGMIMNLDLSPGGGNMHNHLHNHNHGTRGSSPSPATNNNNNITAATATATNSPHSHNNNPLSPPVVVGGTGARETEQQHNTNNNNNNSPVSLPSVAISPTTSLPYSQQQHSQQPECDYDIKPTPLYKKIQMKDWNLVLEILTLDDDIEIQAMTWVVRKEKNGKLRWRLLPLHAALIFQAPSSVVEGLLQVFPQAASCKDDQGMLPLHLSLRNTPIDWESVEELITTYPGAVYTKDRKGRTPLECATAVANRTKINAMAAASGQSSIASSVTGNSLTRMEQQNQQQQSNSNSNNSKDGKDRNNQAALGVLKLYTQIVAVYERQQQQQQNAAHRAANNKATTDTNNNNNTNNNGEEVRSATSSTTTSTSAALAASALQQLSEQHAQRLRQLQNEVDHQKLAYERQIHDQNKQLREVRQRELAVQMKLRQTQQQLHNSTIREREQARDLHLLSQAQPVVTVEPARATVEHAQVVVGGAAASDATMTDTSSSAALSTSSQLVHAALQAARREAQIWKERFRQLQEDSAHVGQVVADQIDQLQVQQRTQYEHSEQFLSHCRQQLLGEIPPTSAPVVPALLQDTNCLLQPSESSTAIEKGEEDESLLALIESSTAGSGTTYSTSSSTDDDHHVRFQSGTKNPNGKSYSTASRSSNESTATTSSGGGSSTLSSSGETLSHYLQPVEIGHDAPDNDDDGCISYSDEKSASVVLVKVPRPEHSSLRQPISEATAMEQLTKDLKNKVPPPTLPSTAAVPPVTSMTTSTTTTTAGTEDLKPPTDMIVNTTATPSPPVAPTITTATAPTPTSAAATPEKSPTRSSSTSPTGRRMLSSSPPAATITLSPRTAATSKAVITGGRPALISTSPINNNIAPRDDRADHHHQISSSNIFPRSLLSNERRDPSPRRAGAGSSHPTSPVATSMVDRISLSRSSHDIE